VLPSRLARLLRPDLQFVICGAPVRKYSTLSSHALANTKGLVKGTDTPAILARARFHLSRGLLESAVEEVSSLEPNSAAVYRNWIEVHHARD